MKYSAFATNVTFRLTISGMKIESENERWLLAMIAGPCSGTFSRPSTTGRKISLSQGPSSTYLSRLYSTLSLPPPHTMTHPPVGAYGARGTRHNGLPQLARPVSRFTGGSGQRAGAPTNARRPR